MSNLTPPPGTDVAVQLAVIEERLRSLDVKLDQWLRQHADHERRIRSLEQVKWMMVGLAAIVGPAATAVVNLLIRNA